MALIIAPDDTGLDDVIRGTRGNDTILTASLGRYYGMGGNDVIRQANTDIRQDGHVLMFGGSGLHSFEDVPFRFNGPYESSGNDYIDVGMWGWADGGGHKAGEREVDRFQVHISPFNDESRATVWADVGTDEIIFANSDKSHDRRVGSAIDGKDFHGDGSGYLNGFQVVEVRFGRHFTSDAGYDYSVINSFVLEYKSTVGTVKTNYVRVATYDKGDAPDFTDFIVRVDPGETSRQAASEMIHQISYADDHPYSEPNQWGYDQFLF